MRRLPSLFAAAALLASARALADPVLDWNDLMLDAIRVDNSGPTLSTRNLAMLHVAIYEAVNSVARTHQPYRRFHDPAGPASTGAAAASAGYEILKVLYPGLRARSDELHLEQLRVLPQDAATANGLALGRTAAYAVLEDRAGDGANTQIPYIPSAEPGQWRRTAPFFRPPLDPHWRHVRLFAIPEKEPFVVPPPPPLGSPEYAEALAEVQELGALESASRTPYQTQTAVFWSDFSYTAMPPGHWHEILAGIVGPRGGSLEEHARLFALVSLAQADAAIVCWEAKYRYNLWRPETAIQRAGEDGNDATVADPAWASRLSAPPFPEYPSGHSTFSKASATLLGLYFGSDRMRFAATSDSLPGVVREYDSFAACADEIGMSRIYGGIHFQFANREGKRSGDRIARHVFEHQLLPLASLPRAVAEVRAPHQVRFRLHGHPGSTLVLEASDDFLEWREVTRTAAVPGGTRVEIDPQALECHFFRVREI